MKIMVLNDGETFTSLNGCSIYEVPNNASTEEIESALQNVRMAIQNDLQDIKIRKIKTFTDK